MQRTEFNCAIDKLRPRKGGLSSNTREYLRQYYMNNREKALAYQKDYYRKHKRSMRRNSSSRPSSRQAVRQALTSCDIMRLSTEKSIRTLNQIMSGERIFIG